MDDQRMLGWLIIIGSGLLMVLAGLGFWLILRPKPTQQATEADPSAEE